jgi:hypothetical protein
VPTVFCVGLIRTGTTTFGDACKALGFTRLGWWEGYSQQLMQRWRKGDIGALRDEAAKWDVLEDLPWSLVYQEMAESFPDAKFALTRRSSVDVWLPSVQRHVAAHGGALYPRVFGIKKGDVDPWIRYREKNESHLREVRTFFSGSDRFAEFCWEEGDGWPELCAFLGVPEPDEPFPHSNPAGWKPSPPPTPLKRALNRAIRG